MNAAAAPMHPFQPAESPAIILASQSAIRRQLLSQAGILFEPKAAAIDEESIKQASQAEGASPGETALLLAELKAARIRLPDALAADVLVIGADQLLVCENQWFDKPQNREQARAQLRLLRGRSHMLHTAITVLRNNQVIWHHIETPVLTMRDFSDEFLEAYLDQECPAILSCVGAYRLEGPGIHLFDRIAGDHSSILGLPLLPLLGFLRQHGAVRK